MQEVTAEVEITLPEGRRTIEMTMKNSYDIEECEEGKIVCLNLINGETHTGIFKGIDGDEDIMLGALSGKHTLGYKIFWLANYFEQK